MNEFTKEELEELLWCCEGEMHDDHPVEDYKIRLHAKIQSMIDNYCEHEFDITDWVNDSSGCRWYECKKCERRYR